MVGRFLSQLNRIAAYYHISLIFSVGAPKASPKEQYTSTRDRIFGSQLWSRMCDTIWMLSCDGDGTGNTRELAILHRNAPSEKFSLEFVGGRLVERATEVETDPLWLWILRLGGKPFTRQAAVDAMKVADAGLGRAAVHNRLAALVEKGRLRQKYNPATGVNELSEVQGEVSPEEKEFAGGVEEAFSKKGVTSFSMFSVEGEDMPTKKQFVILDPSSVAEFPEGKPQRNQGPRLLRRLAMRGDVSRMAAGLRGTSGRSFGAGSEQ